MNDQDKKNVARSGERSVTNGDTVEENLPPPYVFSESCAAEEEKPKLTYDPQIFTEIIPKDNSGLQTRESPVYSLSTGESIRAACCSVFCWFSMPIAFCTDCCNRLCLQSKTKEDR